MKPHRLSFFVELNPPELAALVNDGSTIDHLRALGAQVTIGLRDLSESRARSIQRLSSAGIKVGAWLLLPREQGYFATYDNVSAVEARVEQMLQWTKQHGLTFASLGFDFEPDLRELDRLFHSPTRTVARWARRSTDRLRRERALSSYGSLIRRLQSAGWFIESYQFPLLLEDRAAGSQFFQRLSSSLDVPVQREVMMVYSSLLGPLGPGLAEGWMQGNRAVAVGSTGGGVDPLPKLSFDELARDLRLAARACSDVAIFSLEGCVQHGHLARLVDFDWDAPVELPLHQRLGASSIRSSARLLARLLR
jgi:hypothetical protein